MPYIDSLETFVAEAEKLYVEHPEHTRYVAKYRHVDGKLELKVTNDRVCLKFATDQQQDLKRIDKLNTLFLSYMCGKDPYADPGEEALTSATARPASAGDDAPASSERPGSGGGGGTPGRSKKKAKK